MQRLGVKCSTTPRVLGMAGSGGNQIGEARLLYGGGSETGVPVAVCETLLQAPRMCRGWIRAQHLSGGRETVRHLTDHADIS